MVTAELGNDTQPAGGAQVQVGLDLREQLHLAQRENHENNLSL